MPGDMDGADLAYSVRHSFPNLPVILISGYSEEESAKSAWNRTFPFIQKPFVPDTILSAVRRALAPDNDEDAASKTAGL
jgi:DNA-binding NtrC family response regulator